MTSGVAIINTLPYFQIPGNITGILTDFTKRRRSGQVTLNFHCGKILSADTREHIMIDAVLCGECEARRHKNDREWIVRDGKALCPKCS